MEKNGVRATDRLSDSTAAITELNLNVNEREKMKEKKQDPKTFIVDRVFVCVRVVCAKCGAGYSVWRIFLYIFSLFLLLWLRRVNFHFSFTLFMSLLLFIFIVRASLIKLAGAGHVQCSYYDYKFTIQYNRMHICRIIMAMVAVTTAGQNVVYGYLLWYIRCVWKSE